MNPTPIEYDYENLRGDCERCFGLCCASLPFAVSADFAIDKAAGQPCPNLREDFRCGVHDRLRDIGFRGCTVYDCFGAGQMVSQITFAGQDWRQARETAATMFEVFPVMRQLHELLRYLTEASTMAAAGSLRRDLESLLEETERATRSSPQELLRLDVAELRARVGERLRLASEQVREDALRSQADLRRRKPALGRGADLIGAKLKGRDLRCESLRGAYLIAADLRGANLRFADLLGADLRDADLSGADLTDAIFLTQPQLQSAKGDAATRLSPRLERPAHWAAGASSVPGSRTKKTANPE